MDSQLQMKWVLTGSLLFSTVPRTQPEVGTWLVATQKYVFNYEFIIQKLTVINSINPFMWDRGVDLPGGHEMGFGIRVHKGIAARMSPAPPNEEKV